MLTKALNARKTHPDLLLFAGASFLMSLGFALYMATAANFAVDIIHIQPHEYGWLEAVRELPGFLVAGVAALTMRIAEPKLARMALGVLGVGLLAYVTVHSLAPLIVFSLVWSIGMHTWMPVSSSMTLALAEKGNKGRRLGQLGAVGSLATILGLLIVRLLNEHLSYQIWFAIAGGMCLLAAVVVGFVRKDIGRPDKPRLVIKRRYSVYYGLTFLEGCRKQVFLTFAVLTLVKVYHTRLATVAMLMLINSVLNLLLAPKVGRLIDRIGERKVFSFSYFCLILVFLGYALVPSAHALYVFYCLDSLLFLSSMGLTTFLNRIADPQDVMPSLTMGVTFNHTAAVVVPLIGGYLWTRMGYQAAFFGGAFVVAISLILAQEVGRKGEVACS